MVKDSKGNIFSGLGSKVTKYEPLTIEATPEEGYSLKTFSLNGEDAREGNTFDMPGIYTKLRPTFAKSSAIDNIASDGLRISAAGNFIMLSTDCGNADLQVVRIDGSVVFSGSVADSTLLPVDEGVYVVKAKDAKNNLTTKVRI